MTDVQRAGSVAIVTGGAGGIGAAITRRLAADGFHVVVADVLDDAGAQLSSEITDATYVHHDVSDEASWHRLVEELQHRPLPVSVLINAAAVITWDVPLEHTSLADYRRIVDVNQVGVFLGMRSCIRLLRDSGGGSIVNMSSTGGMTGAVGLVSYVATKWAVRGMTKTAALELGVDNIRVNSVHPGRFDTPMTAGLPQPMDQPIPGSGDLGDLAALVAYLASDQSRFVTGAEFVIDGGQLAGRMKRLGPANTGTNLPS